MSTKPTIIAVVIAIIMVIAMAVTIRSDMRSAPRTTVYEPLLSAADLPADQVTTISLERRGEPALLFERTGNRWRQTAPFAHPMDAFSIQQFVTIATRLQVADRLSSEELSDDRSLGALKLEPPEAELEYRWAGGALKLELGRRGLAGRSFIRIGGASDVCVVNQDLHDRAVDMDPREWRDRTLFIDVSVDADRIERVDDANRVVLERDRGQWLLVEPVRTRLDAQIRDEFFLALGRARSSGFILDRSDKADAFGLDDPVATLTVTSSVAVTAQDGTVTREPVVQQLIIGNRVGGTQDRFAMMVGRPTVIRVSAQTLAALFRQPQELADRTASGIVPADIKALEISSADGRIRFERDLERWVAPEAGSLEVDRELVEELLRQLTQLRAPRVEIREYPTALEVATVTLYGFDAKPKDTVRVARDPENGEVALENGDNVLRVFPESIGIRLTSADFGLPE